MQFMDQQQDPLEENRKMFETNIQQFINAARQYLFGLMPAQPVLATIPVRCSR
jgi:hypothetical protein